MTENPSNKYFESSFFLKCYSCVVVFRHICKFPWDMIRSLLLSTVQYFLSFSTTPSVKLVIKSSFIRSKEKTISGYSHILSELISGINVSASLETTRRYIILSQDCKLIPNLSVWLSERCFCTEPISEQLSVYLNRYVETLSSAIRTLFSNTEILNT